MKKTLAIFSLACCEGCEFEMLNHYEEFATLLPYFDIKNFRLGQEDNVPGPFDVAIIEGNPESERQRRFARKIRASAGVVIGMGACAHLGGIQSERNRVSRKLIDKEPVKNLRDIIKVDFMVPGCPINHKELYKCLLDVYWGKTFTLPDLAVCFECRQNENECHLKNDRPCLGPITRMGCDSICINNGESCLGCRGTIPQPNIDKMKEILGNIITEEEVGNMMSFYGDYELENKKEQGLV